MDLLCARPLRAPSWRRGASPGGGLRRQHSQGAHDVDDAAHTGFDAGLVESQRLAGLVQQHGHALARCHFAQRTGADRCIEQYRHAEAARQPGGFFVGEIGADLRQIVAVQGTGMQIDAVGGVAHDLGHEQVGETGGERAVGGAGKAAVELTAVRQITRVMNEAKDIDEGHGQQHAADALLQRQAQQAPDDLDAIDLIAVDRRRYEQPRARLPAVHHVHRHGDFAMSVEPRHPEIDGDTSTGRHPRFIDQQAVVCIHLLAFVYQPLPRVLVLWGLAFSSMNSMMSVVTSLPLAVSIPSRPGEEFTSITSGPRCERRMSTPATLRPMARAARTAVDRSAGVSLTALAVPPRCRLERNSPSLAWRFIAATTLLPTTKQRISAPPAS